MLEAKVEEQNWQVLQDTFAAMTKLIPPEIKSSYLLQEQSDKSIWRIVTFWESQTALSAMRATGETPTGVVIFQKANAKPDLTILDVTNSAN